LVAEDTSAAEALAV